MPGLLGMQAPSEQANPSPPEKDYRDRYEELTGPSVRQCPVCRQDRMVVVEILPRSDHNRPEIIDSS